MLYHQTNPSLRVYIYKAFLFLTFMAIAFGLSAKAELTINDYFDFDKLSQEDRNWKVTQEILNEDQGRIRLSNSLWLMYFLHWKSPAIPDSALTNEFAKDHLLNFWGEAMPFELSGEPYETEVSGHRALALNATIYDSTISTRFIIWNCPETNRLFTSDCNINLRAGTPLYNLETQDTMTKTIKCHPPYKNEKHNIIPLRHHSENWGVSFMKPDRWITKDFVYPEWYSEGLTKENGSLWTLIKDSDRKIDLRWKVIDGDVTNELMTDMINSFSLDERIVSDTNLTLEISFSPIEKQGNFLSANGDLNINQMHQGQTYSTKYNYDSILWENDGKAYLLTVVSVNIETMWGLPFNLAWTRDELNEFLRNKAVPLVSADIK